MSLFEQIQAEMAASLKERDADKLRTLRFLLAQINNLVIDKYPPGKGGLPAAGLPDEDVIQVVQKLVKTHQESIAAFKAGNRPDLVQKEEVELGVLQSFLPMSMSEEEIRKMAEELKVGGQTDFGQLMKELMGKVKGRADGGTVSKIVKEVLGD